MKRNIIIIAGILCTPISCAFAYSEPECTLPLSVFQEYAKKSGSTCDPSTITKVVYYAGYQGWVVFGTGDSKKCTFRMSTAYNGDIDHNVQGGGNCTVLSTYTLLTSTGVPYACNSDSDCDTDNGWVCKNINSTYGVGICTQTSCGPNCKVGVSEWRKSATEGYEEQVKVECQTNSDTTYKNYYCTGSPIGRCAPGYYGTNVSVAPPSGCTRCPPYDNSTNKDVYGTSTSGATSITQCYIKKGTSLKDSNGTFTFDPYCYYKK